MQEMLPPVFYFHESHDYLYIWVDFHLNSEATAKQQRSNSEATAKQQRSNSEATTKQLQSNYGYTSACGRHTAEGFFSGVSYSRNTKTQNLIFT